MCVWVSSFRGVLVFCFCFLLRAAGGLWSNISTTYYHKSQSLEDLYYGWISIGIYRFKAYLSGDWGQFCCLLACFAQALKSGFLLAVSGL